jgi:hypothetical protein
VTHQPRRWRPHASGVAPSTERGSPRSETRPEWRSANGQISAVSAIEAISNPHRLDNRPVAGDSRTAHQSMVLLPVSVLAPAEPPEDARGRASAVARASPFAHAPEATHRRMRKNADDTADLEGVKALYAAGRLREALQNCCSRRTTSPTSRAAPLRWRARSRRSLRSAGCYCPLPETCFARNP